MTRTAATLLMTRAGSAGLEVLMARRTGTASFASGLWVFPGGVVDPVDRTPLARRLLGGAGADREQAPYMSAALRETAEEINAFVTTEPPPDDLWATLGRLEGEPLLAAMDEAGLRFATAGMAYWANWITPRSQPKRYDTRFFIVEVDSNLRFEPDRAEIMEVTWVAPERALAGRKDAYRMMFPTIRNLVRLARFGSPAEAIADARTTPVEPIEPAPIFDEAGKLKKLLIPGDDGYEAHLAAQLPFGSEKR